MAKQRWSKFWDAEYLADDRVRQLSWGATGILHALWSYSRTQTDSPGKLIVKGIRLRSDDVLITLFVMRPPYPGTTRAHIRVWLDEVIRLRFFVEDEDGTLYSPRIVEEHERYINQSTYGKRGRSKQLAPLYNDYKTTPGPTPRGTPGPTPGVEVEEEYKKERPGPSAPESEDATSPPNREPGQQKPLEQLTAERRALFDRLSKLPLSEQPAWYVAIIEKRKARHKSLDKLTQMS